jgi:hypothetical protein
MSKFFITIPRDLDEVLDWLARENLRDPQKEASWLLAKAIRAAAQEKQQQTVVAQGTQD